MLHQDIFARVGGVEHSLEDLLHHQHALQHAARLCHQPGDQVIIHKVQNQKIRNAEHEKNAALHYHDSCVLTNHSNFDSKANNQIRGCWVSS